MPKFIVFLLVVVLPAEVPSMGCNESFTAFQDRCPLQDLSLLDGYMPAPSVIEKIQAEFCDETGACNSALDAVMTACSSKAADPAFNAALTASNASILGIAIVCDPCFNPLMELALEMEQNCGINVGDLEVHNLDVHDLYDLEVCGSGCQGLWKRWTSCVAKFWKSSDNLNADNGRRLQFRLQALPQTRRLEETLNRTINLEEVDRNFKHLEQMCEHCPQAVWSVGEHCVSGEDGPTIEDVKKPGCTSAYCQVDANCPTDPKASPVPDMSLANYTSLRGLVSDIVEGCPTKTTTTTTSPGGDHLISGSITYSLGCVLLIKFLGLLV